MFKISRKIAATLAFFVYITPFTVLTTFAQDEALIADVIPEEVTFKAAIKAGDSIQLDKNIIFDASGTTHPNADANITYTWDFGDGNKKEGREVVNTYTTLGKKTVTLTANDGNETQTVSKDIFVYKKIIIFITDKAAIKDRIEGFKNYARDRDADIVVYESYDSATEFITEEILERKLRESTENLKKIDEIIVWTEGNSGLSALSRIKQNQSGQEELLTFDNKTILVVSDDDQGTTQLQRQYELLKPKNIVSAKEAAIYAFIESSTPDEFIGRMEKDGYDYQLTNAQTGQLQIWNFMSYFVNYLIDSGIPANTVMLILMLPVIATVVSIMKQVVGLTTFGVYTPTIITLTFWILGIKLGLLTLLIVFIVGTGARAVLKRYRLLYVPKMAIVLSSVAIAILFMLIVSIRFNLFDAQFYSLSVFPMLILSTLTEKFVDAQGSKGFKQAMILTLQTVLVAVIAYIVIGGEVDLYLFKLKFIALQGFMLSYPEVIILIIFFNIFLGRWTGLRLLEYVRFREVLRHVEEE
ncbi:hypothetical protein C0416_03325 [bacterium]|nr:hypothetical protein [bacterium]